MYILILFYHILELFGDHRLVKTVKLLPLSIKSVNPVQKYYWIHYWIICLYSKKICCNRSSIDELFDFFWNVFDSKTVKISYYITIWIQSNPMSADISIPVKIFWICLILYFIRQFITWIVLIKFVLILIMSLYI